MPIQNQQGGEVGPLKVQDFSGGITDNFVDAPMNQFQRAQNFLITDNKKLNTRPGTVIRDTSYPQTPAGNVRISGYMRTEDKFFEVAGGRFFSDGVELLGPSGASVFPSDSNSSLFAHSNFDKTYIVTSSEFGSPKKIFPDVNGDYQVRNAGLPGVDLTSLITLANEIKTKFNAHVLDALQHTGPGGADVGNSVSTGDATNFSSLLDLTNALTDKYTAHIVDALLVSPDHHTATGSDYSLSSTTEVKTLSEVSTRLLDIRTKYNTHNLDVVAHAVFISHQADTALTIQPVISGAAGTNQYIYAIVAFYEYNVATIVFQDFGPADEQLVTAVDAPDVSPITISDIPVISNGTTESYDTANIKWVVYRSENLGTVLYEVGRIDNGVTSFVDNRSDSDIVSSNLPIYTTGGVLNNDVPPEAKYNVTVNDITWYGHVREGSEIRGNRLYQSIKFDPDSVPITFYEDFEDEIIGLGSVNIYPIVFCNNRIFRLEGFLDETGDGFITKREISRTRGSVNHNSIVNVTIPATGTEGLVFASSDGFYFTDGFNLMKVSDLFDKRYKTLIRTDAQRSNIYGEYDGLNDRVYWAVTQDVSANSENDRFYVFDMDFGVKSDGAFTTIVPDSKSWSPTAISFDNNGDLVIGDRRGFSFKFKDNELTDPRIDLLESDVTQWRTRPIIWDYISVATNGGDPNIRKWLNLLIINMENSTNISLSPQFDRENSGNFSEIKEIRLRESITWGDYSVLWQDSTPGQVPVYPWDTFPFIAQKRRFVSGRLRVNYLTIRLTNSETIITNSDTLGLAAVSGGDTVTLSPATGPEVWPEDITDYMFAFEVDGYMQTYRVATRNSDTEVTVFGTPPAGASQKWHLLGVQQGEAFNMVDYSVNWQPLTPSFVPYRASSSGANG